MPIDKHVQELLGLEKKMLIHYLILNMHFMVVVWIVKGLGVWNLRL